MTPANQVAPAVRPLYWSTERYLALVDSGVIHEGPRVELVEGQVIETMPQGKTHLLLFRALQRAFSAMGGFEKGLIVQPTIVMEQGNVYDPEFAFLPPEFEEMEELPRGRDVLFLVEVSVTSLSEDLGPKKSAYAAAKIPTYWVVDGVKHGLWVFTKPVDGAYQGETFFGSGEEVEVPVLGSTLQLGSIFDLRQASIG